MNWCHDGVNSYCLPADMSAGCTEKGPSKVSSYCLLAAGALLFFTGGISTSRKF